MTIPIGGDKLNLEPCIKEDELQNLQQINNFQNTVNNFMSNPDAFMALLTLVNLSYNPSNNTLTASVGSDNKKVLVSGGDNTDEYLAASMNDPDTYDTGTADQLILSDIGSPGANEKLRLFLRLNTAFFTKLFASLNLTNLTYDSGTNTLSASGGGGGSAKIGNNDSTITGRSSLTLGSGTVSVYDLTAGVLSDSGSNETWYNVAEQGIPSGGWLLATEVNGQMVVTSQFCMV
jgi:hypothetical protein